MIAWFALLACGGLDRYQVDCTGESTPRLLRRLTHVEYVNSVRDVLGVEVDPLSFAADPIIEGYRNDAYALEVNPLLAEQYRSVAEQIGEQIDPEVLVACDRGASGDSVCASLFVTDIGFELFRRPLSTSDVDAYLELWTSVAIEAGFDEGLRWVVVAMLQSPHFLYRSELGVKGDKGRFELTKWEVATELSYTYLGTTPSRDLLDRVDGGLLEEPDDVGEVAQEMLADARSFEVTADFAEVWLDTSQLATVSRDGLTPELRDAMRTQTRELVASVASGEGTLADLVDAGVLLEPSVLTTHGRPSGSGPVQRGLFVRERLLCTELPPPPSNLNVSPPEVDVTKTTREQYAQHSADPACLGCHSKIDPLGFAFEHYDQLGAYRELDNGFPIDDSGDVDDVPFTGPEELSQVLLDDERFRSCFVATWRRHATGLPACGEDLGADVGLRAPLVSLTGLTPFTSRVGGEDEGDTFAKGTRGTPAPPESTIPLPPGDVQFSLATMSDWGGGYCAQGTVTNGSGKEQRWSGTAQPDGVIANIWDASVTEAGGEWVFAGVGWNDTLQPGATTTFGFCATRQ